MSDERFDVKTLKDFCHERRPLSDSAYKDITGKVIRPFVIDAMGQAMNPYIIEELREEAIKWWKRYNAISLKDKNTFDAGSLHGMMCFIEEFFNLTPEDLK